jgi:hypothetical protein
VACIQLRNKRRCMLEKGVRGEHPNLGEAG